MIFCDPVIESTDSDGDKSYEIAKADIVEWLDTMPRGSNYLGRNVNVSALSIRFGWSLCDDNYIRYEFTITT